MHGIEDDARALIEFEKVRFDFAWRHFEFHARQRTTMFHFFVLLVPFLFAGFYRLKEGANHLRKKHGEQSERLMSAFVLTLSA